MSVWWRQDGMFCGGVAEIVHQQYLKKVEAGLVGAVTGSGALSRVENDSRK